MIIPVFIPQEGCPHQCVFCNQQTISGQKALGLEAAKMQIEKYLQWLKPSEENEIAFYGGTFTGLSLARQKELLTLANEYRAQGLISKIRLSTRPDYINDEIIENLKAFGVTTVELGAQSLNDTVLKAVGRGHTTADIVHSFQKLRQAGFLVGLQLMVGLPKETFSIFKETVEKVVELKPDIVRIYPLLVIKNTPLEKLYEDGLYTPLSLEEATKASYYAYEKFSAVGIKVIRMGLQADDELCAKGNIVAGPFHPSFGEMVKSYGYRVKIQEFIDLLPEAKKKILITHTKKETSMVRGLNKSNIKYWKKSKVEIEFQIGEKFNITLNS